MTNEVMVRKIKDWCQMEWLIDLFMPHNLSLANTILLYSFVIFAGIYLGKIKFFGVSLGVTCIFSGNSD